MNYGLMKKNKVFRHGSVLQYRNKKALMPWIIIVLCNFILGDYDIRDKASKLSSKLVVRTQGGKR